jgi:hypothetical protein
LGFVPKPTSAGELSNFQPAFVPLNTHTVWGVTLDHNFNSRQALHVVYWRNEEHIAGGFVDNPLNRYTLSQRNDLKANSDGSIDIYFGPEPPTGKEANWIQTVAGKG